MVARDGKSWRKILSEGETQTDDDELQIFKEINFDQLLKFIHQKPRSIVYYNEFKLRLSEVVHEGSNSSA